jgi:RNA polymerase sigma-70 factor, ECF subfamily
MTETEFLDVRDRMLRIARRITAGRTDADDVVQEAWLRWNRTDRATIRDVPAFLCHTTTNLAINAIQSAHVRHRGALPPAERAGGLDPATVVERADDVRTAMRILDERLTPRERRAFVMREAYGYPHRQIGDALGMTEANTRQMLRRARAKLDSLISV